MTENHVIEKIRKLLRLAQDQGATPGEAANAAAAAQALMFEHQISQASLALDGAPEAPIGTEALDGADARHTWQVRLSSVVASANFCRILLNGRYAGMCANPDVFATHLARGLHRNGVCVVCGRWSRVVVVLGRPDAVATVRYLFAFLAREIERFVDRDARGRGRTFINNFRLGAVEVIGRRLAEQRKASAEAQVTSTALVLVSREELAIKNALDALGLRRGPRRNSAYSNEGRAAGRRAGAEVDLSGGAGKLGAPAKRLKEV